MKRRTFIKSSCLTALLLFSNESLFAKSTFNKTLILLELNGGNDSLNTIVPYKEKNYYKLRETLALKKDEINIISDKFALNKNLDFLTQLYKENSLAIVNNLGYEKPNKSHFRAIQIVETASNSNEYLKDGWLSSHLEEYNINDLRPANALVIGKRKKGYLFSKNLNILQIKNVKDFIEKSKGMNSFSKSKSLNSSNTKLDFLYKQKRSILQASSSLNKYARDININETFEESDISKDFKEAAKIIKSKINFPVIKISQKGYDTHSDQKNRQNVLLKDLDNALKSFVTFLKAENLYDSVLIVSYSEFGRRVKENGSEGTDHGTSSSQFVLGGLVKGGFYGKEASLDKLHKNNLIYTTHYRSLYNTILSSWFLNKNNHFNTYDTLNFL